ncbi:DUF1217 domain-containing protein [Sneathiella sp. P13V-1]|uniref:DUF1217 domain-containing protein n=1 Tax=Sneathiella sp. P13V-1 TaxID=2697366 RepID=UPI00187B67D1|nr:DUF1217 domain-containing protein [Sneathiella sp. P13V-1]MBE7635213.1 DUF1217 domain-containing protein [Sneathiella sp. P13V-1]
MQLSANSSLLWYKLANDQRDSHMKLFEAQPTTARDIEKFKEEIVNIKSVDDLMKNRTLLGVTLSAFQLESEIDKTAFVKKMLTEDPSADDSLVNRLVEPRWTKLANSLYELNSNPDFFLNEKNVEALLEGYKTNEFEKFEGQNAEGVRESMYFKRIAGQVEEIPQILADKTLMQVVRVGLGLPESFLSLDYEQQKARLTKEVDLEDFKDPAKIDKMIERYLIMTEVNNSDATANPMLSLFQPLSGGGTVGPMPVSLNLNV